MVADEATINEGNSIEIIKDFFERTVKLIRKTNADKNDDVTISQDQQLRLYGLYKRCTEGKLVAASSDTISSASSSNSCEAEDLEDAVVYRNRPSFLQVTSRYKYDAWLECSLRHHRKHEARLEYIEGALQLLLQSTSVDTEEVALIHQDFQSWLAAANKNQASTKVEEDELATDKTSAVTRFYRIWNLISSMKLYPRGTLDISWNDFLFAAYYSLFYMLLSKLFPSSKEESLHQSLTDKIEKLWIKEEESKEEVSKIHVLTSLSVRSAFDLYLQAKQYPPGSSIIVSAIQIEGMIVVAKYHGLTIIPVDCSSIDNVAPSIPMIMEKVTTKTVAVLIAHAFGFVGYSEKDFQSLKEQLQLVNNTIDLVEDCAECFPYRGSSHSDVVFISFGVIKTSTALGGAISIIQNHHVYTKMKQLQMHYKMKSNRYFLANRVLKCLFLNWVSRSPFLCGILCKSCQYILGDVSSFDKLITSSIKGFPTSSSQNPEQLLIRLLRYRPSCANLALLYRRIASPTTVRVIHERTHRCRQMIRRISSATGGTITFPGHQEDANIGPLCRHYYWLLPIMVNNPDHVSQRLLQAGFDVPR